MMFCLNLCEILTDDWIERKYFEKLFNLLSQEKDLIERIYIGSSFCSQYYIRFSGYDKLLDFCMEENIPVTLVLPVFSEKDLNVGKRKTNEIIYYSQGIVDEITVNDVGALWWIQNSYNICINIGRLFFKDPRDCRIPEYCDKEIQPSFLTHFSDDYWNCFNISGIELDPTNRIIDISCINSNNFEVGLHMPYCYMTTGNICKFASIHKSIEQKFRPNQPCTMECMHINDVYTGHVNQTNCDPVLYRFGRTLYYKVDYPVVFSVNRPVRVIYFPIDEWRNMRNENIDSPE